MQKIASNGATVSNEFTEGNAGLAIPATVVSADWLNSIQREIVNAISLLANFVPLTPLTDTFDQIAEAIKEFFLRGGQVVSIAQSITNNQASAADVSLFPTFSKLLVRALKIDYYLRRRTDTENVHVFGTMKAVYNVETNAFEVYQDETISSGVVLSVVVDPIDLSGNTYKVQYTSDTLTGASYASEMKLTSLTQIRI